MSSGSTPLLLSPSQVHNLTRSNKPVAFLDASWVMPNSSRKPYNEFLAKRIPGAQFLDVDEVSSPHPLGLKHMMPTGRVFADACEAFGIEPSSHVVIYDTSGVFSSPRALFMFRTFGHSNSSIINGGLPAWMDLGLPVESGPLTKTRTVRYETPLLDTEALRNYDEIVANSQEPSTSSRTSLVLDARARGRYLGQEPEPRPGLASGHIPRSLSLPFNLFLKKNAAKDGTEFTTLLPEPDLKVALADAIGAEHTTHIMQGLMPVITSCGSGMTAAVLWLGLKCLGVEKVSLYDESWTGYAMRPTSKIETINT
ncbi:Rhodanese-like domain-containing protein [Collybia nuda]|uniref:Rhodanese-like domain-containing protein n=1 Tax=Collybia nuda TaxID=64659 RepID=A0A9P5XSP9_9AGAR|nr:Rhodanese-like domain-containing protein [Collybia nuda]